ncbi:bifunctional oligoribonuclease/PAP phosphatase NrnA [Solwaraspora sp. WMMD406]|uniref:DHH family phosphoesterase n=1 Tax=Solwaraspora sp. WMMD406 TaxID=3016095 RepID=UPI00241802F4|nr:bifunctional oligoribonuclease/PAP phosphatase NrnA [Solwaraspora sp. WMMD406]MDG4767124.1 bifunctional oligoribonuclease/PAP phosphatase NrnA [Solwaraspora sp. WMMD406]
MISVPSPANPLAERASSTPGGPTEQDPGGPTEQEWSAAVAAIRAAGPTGRVLLMCHVLPDGDALGSMLGFGLALRRGSEARIQATFPGTTDLPPSLREMPGQELLVPADRAWTDPDLVLCFDVASDSRLGPLAGRLATAPSIVVDHHASNTRFGQIHLVDPHAAATSVVVEGLLDRLGFGVDQQVAECLYIALVTDTGSFRFDMTTPAVHQMAARLLATGIRPADISRRLFDSRPFGAVQLFGEVLRRAVLEPDSAGGRGLVWTYATLADLERYDQQPYVLEALIDSVRCTIEADMACVLKQVGETSWAVSMRSKGGVDVSRVATALGGGGHRLAAGFTGQGEVSEVIAAIRAEVR